MLALLAPALVAFQQTLVLPPAPTATATNAPDDWTALRQRPLRLPTLALGATCPINHAHQVNPGYGPGIGDGPAYAAIAGDGVLSFQPPATFESAEWGGGKVLWYFTPAVRGPVLIRGHQLDGSNEVRFEQGALPPTELTFSADGTDPGGWSGRSSYTRVRAAGCYAYQVDGASFTEIVVFEARPAQSTCASAGCGL